MEEPIFWDKIEGLLKLEFGSGIFKNLKMRVLFFEIGGGGGGDP